MAETFPVGGSTPPRRCYCGGPEEQVYGHEHGEGRHCRSQGSVGGSTPTPAEKRDCTCEPHRDPALRPWGVRLSAETDADGRPAYLVVGPASGGHVSQRDVDWVWAQLNRETESREPQQRPYTTRLGRGA